MGHSVSEVAMKFRFSHRTISRVYREYQESPLKHQIYGRKKIMQERDQRRLTRIIKRDKLATFPQITADFNAWLSTSVTVRIIQRNIIDMGFRRRSSTRVHLLTTRHKALRLAWARQYRHWTVEDWKHFACSYESLFQLNRTDGRVRV
ncbi:HTH_Tnp_Tc3_2 domain-containing protein [Trichonephila clavipes]|nr:HTH_Tnp_Tc3_2 domain-containing protein [Trichonephila clavipes]